MAVEVRPVVGVDLEVVADQPPQVFAGGLPDLDKLVDRASSVIVLCQPVDK